MKGIAVDSKGGGGWWNSRPHGGAGRRLAPPSSPGEYISEPPLPIEPARPTAGTTFHLQPVGMGKPLDGGVHVSPTECLHRSGADRCRSADSGLAELCGGGLKAMGSDARAELQGQRGEDSREAG